MNREKLARDAFWGGNEELAEQVMRKNCYMVDGVFYPANGLSLAEFILTVEGMSEDELLGRIPERGGRDDEH